MRTEKKYGLLTEKQLKVLALRALGLTLREVARLLGVSHQDVAVAEKRALKNIRLAKLSIIAYKIATSPVRVVAKEGMKHVEVASAVFESADRAGIKVQLDVGSLLRLVWRRARECIEGIRVKKPVLILVDEHGEVEVYPYHEVQHILEKVEEVLRSACGRKQA